MNKHRTAHRTLKKANQRLKQLSTDGTVSDRIKITINKEKIERESNISKIMIEKEQPSSSQSNDSKIMACMRRKEIRSPIDFLFGLPINLIVNVGQNKFEVDISKNVAKIANLRPKIGQLPLLSLDINGHNSIIFYPILTFFIINCLFLRDESNGVQI